ncbi:MAG: sulfite exporter TauE/SafE family protein [Planctomycetota bacterium]|jgi:uncharacterized membrane protein YfcA
MEILIPAVIGLVTGVLGGLLGVGGSLVIIPAMTLYLSEAGQYTGTTQHLLQAAAMICNPFAVAPSVVAHWRVEAIIKPVLVYLIPSAAIGILLGVGLSNASVFARENGAYLAIVLSGFLAYVVVYNVWRLFQQTGSAREFDASQKLLGWKTAIVGLPMGFMAGLLGVGGGALCVPMQQVLLGIPLRRAIANSAVTILCVSPIGAIFKNATLQNDHGVPIADSLQLALTLIPTTLVGSYIGGKLTHALPRTALRVAFLAFMATMAYITFTRAWKVVAPPAGACLPVEPTAIDPQNDNVVRATNGSPDSSAQA